MEDVLAVEWQQLTTQERILRCRAFAAEASRRAETATAHMKPTYTALEREWTKLADEMELQLLCGNIGP